ncbi:12792_t:CDS:2 [Dentiscutata erythropus]|uniref:12792_t:CDS:1 n=1 Tax=Dentiscutata erythropus TaxID=1348616 RepID=A0A9N9D1P2_9GLOM|nr:12792_t:CDS:2 [Dentiscutata erythropus]
MTELIMPKVNDEFKSLKAFENAAKSAAKYRGFAFSRKDSNLTGHNGKSSFVVVTKTEFKHNHSMLELEEVATFPQYHSISLSQKILVKQLHNNNTPTQVITAAVNRTIDSKMILSKDIINKYAYIRLALNKEVAKCIAKCPEVLIVDSIYQTNIYKYLLVSMIEDENKAFLKTDKILHLLKQNLKVNCHKLFKPDDDYEAFKKDIEAL